MIKFDNATKYADIKGMRKAIIEGVSMEIAGNDGVALLGRNGAGKSTLLRLIAGTLQLDDGRIQREGRISWPLGFKGSFQPSLSGEQNVRFVARIYGVDAGELIDFVEDFAELGHFYRAPVKAYSSGMKARLAFGISMGIKFDCYLVDEVTAVGDSAFKKKCFEVFQERLESSQIIMVSHSSATIRGYCKRGIVLEHGQLTSYDDIEEALEVHDRNMGTKDREF